MNLAFIEKLSKVKNQAEMNALLEQGYEIEGDVAADAIDYSNAFKAVLRYGKPVLFVKEYLNNIIDSYSDILPASEIISALGSREIGDEKKLKLFESSKNKLSSDDFDKLYNSYQFPRVIKEDILENHVDKLTSATIKSVITSYQLENAIKIRVFEAAKNNISSDDLIDIYCRFSLPQEIKDAIHAMPFDKMPSTLIVTIITSYVVDHEFKLKLFESTKDRLTVAEVKALINSFSVPIKIVNEMIDKYWDILQAPEIIIALKGYQADDTIKLKMFDSIKDSLTPAQLASLCDSYWVPTQIASEILDKYLDKLQPAEIMSALRSSKADDTSKLKALWSIRDTFTTEQLTTMYNDSNAPKEIKVLALEVIGLSLISGDIMSAMSSFSDAVVKTKIFELAYDKLSEENLITLFNNNYTPTDIKLKIIDLIGDKLLSGNIITDLTNYSLDGQLRAKLFEKNIGKLSDADFINLFDQSYSLPNSIKVKILELALEDNFFSSAEKFVGLLGMNMFDSSSADELKLRIYQAQVEKFTFKEINAVFSNYNTPDSVRMDILENSLDMLTNKSINVAYLNSVFAKSTFSLKLLEVLRDRIEAETLAISFNSEDKDVQSKTWLYLKDTASEAHISVGFIGAYNNKNSDLFNVILESTKGVVYAEARVSILTRIMYTTENSEFDQTIMSIIKGQILRDDIFKVFKSLASTPQSENGLKKLFEMFHEKISPNDVFLVLKDVVITGAVHVLDNIMEVMSSKITSNIIPELIKTAFKHNFDSLKKLLEKHSDVTEELLAQGISPKLLGYLREQHHISTQFIKEIAREHFAKGNFEQSFKFAALDNIIDVDADGLDIMVEAIQTGLKNSGEPNKYQALIQLMNKAGIRFPLEHQLKLKEVKDNHNSADFKFIDGLAHKLANHYLSMNERVGDALIHLDNDFALEVLLINGITPQPFGDDVRVYRGIRSTTTEADIQKMFEYGIRGYSVGESQKVLGYCVGTEWNSADSCKWEFGGTYVSFEPLLASTYARGETINGHTNSDGILYEISLPKETSKVCGSYASQYELIPSYILGENIVAVYKLKVTDLGTVAINEVYANPNRLVSPRYKVGENIELDNEAIKTYQEVCNGASTEDLYANQDDFYAKYTEEVYAANQAKLWENFFAGRGFYEEDFFAKECNPDLYCC